MADHAATVGIGPDKLAIFVSSTIGECADERLAAKRAIISINHRPLLFESAGAREHPPRRLYLNLLLESHIFIGIYRDRYGWVAPDMSVSGLEDEYRTASARGMPKLIYIYADQSGRDSKLQELIDEFKQRAELTFASYTQPAELEQRIRDDLTATISDRFARFPRAAQPDDEAAPVLTGIARSGLTEVVRRDILADVDRKLATGSVCVYGPMGSGKTVLLARLSKEKQYAFVNCASLGPMDALIKCAAALRMKSGQVVGVCADLPAAINEFNEAVSSLNEFTLVVDDCTRPDLLIDSIARSADTNSMRRICFSSRSVPVTYTGAQVAVPQFAESEIREATSNVPSDIPKLLAASDGNPLYLRFFVATGGQYEESLSAYELKVFQELPPRIRELCTFVAVSEEALSLEDLHDLLGAAESVEATAGLLHQAQGLLVERDGAYELFHDHLRQTIRRRLAGDRPLKGFYGKRLANHFQLRARYLGAFSALEFAESADIGAVLTQAAFEAGVQGDVIRGRRVLQRQIELADVTGNRSNRAHALVSLAQLLEVTGNIEEGRGHLLEAVHIARETEDPDLLSFVEERLVTAEARLGTASGVSKLEALRDNASQEGDEWRAGRLSLELSALHIRNDDSRRASTEAGVAVELFTRVKDEYGVTLAKRNLASAYLASGNPEDESKGLQIAAEFESQKEPTPREKAWLLNLRARQARRQKQPEFAATLSLEAVEIGEALGDTSVVLVNTINYGNALADQSEYEKAVEAYRRASQIAATAGDVRGEAQSEMLVATTTNKLQKFQEARLAALKAVAKAKHAQSMHIAARAGEELGDALVGLGDKKKAASSYFDAARSIRSDPDERHLFWQLLVSGLSLLVEDEQYNEYLSLLDEFLTSDAEAPERAGLSSEEIAVLQAVSMAAQCVPVWAVRAHALHSKVLFRRATGRFKAKLTEMLVGRILNVRGRSSVGQLLAAIVYVAATPPDAHSRFSLVSMAEQLAESVDGLHFRPAGDGAANWTLKVNADPNVIVSLRQMDDRRDTFVAAWLIAALLKSLETRLHKAIFSNAGLVQRELMIWISNEDEVRAQIDIADSVLGEALQDTSAVTRPSRFEKGNFTQTFVICRSDIAQLWSPASGAGNALELLLMQLLSEISYQLYEGEVDLKLIAPEIGRLINLWLR